MNKRFSILLYEITGFSKNDLDNFSKSLKNSPYNEEDGFGFFDIETHVNYLSATLIKKTPAFISEYDNTKKIMIKKTIFVYSNIKFAVDTEYNLLEVYASQKDSSKLRSLLNDFFKKNITLKQVTFSPSEIVTILKERTKRLNIEKLKIDGFHYMKKAYGNFNISKTEQEFTNELFSEYQNEIKKITLTADFDNLEDIELTFSKNGQLVIKSVDIEDALIIIKSIIFKI